MTEVRKTPLLIGLFGMKCPTCRKGDVFVNKHVFPLGKCLAMVDHCSVCGHKMKHESNNGGGINYALTVMLFFLNLLWYVPIFHITFIGYNDYSLYYYLITSTVVVILLQPWLMRLSRMIYIYLFAGMTGNKQ